MSQIAPSSCQPASTSHRFAVGDRVNWVQVPKSGWGLGQCVAGVVRKLGAKRVLIEVKFRPPYSRSKLWESALKWVSPSQLEQRIYPSSAHAELMRLEVAGFVLTPWMHPNGVSRHFKDGTYYGAIDSDGVHATSPHHLTCTAPCTSPEQAISDAHHSLQHGGYRAHLLTQIDIRAHWLRTGAVVGDKAVTTQDEIGLLRARLLKLFTAFPEQIQPCDPTLVDLAQSVDSSKVGSCV
ncbi:hypothetical protein [Paucibacter soli]|uniref:hypothetical protein n=1 Tax=Paucibacter soli TaxID=3133433 RepID=UPI0030B581FA